MGEQAFAKTTNGSSVCLQPITYTGEIRRMMHGFGDCSEPLVESAKIIEEVVLQQMRTIVRKAAELAEKRDSTVKVISITTDDLIFLLRKDKVKLQRLMKYLDLLKFKASINKVADSDAPENAMEVEQTRDSNSKDPYYSILDLLDTTGQLLESASTEDYVKQSRCVRAEMMSRSMDEVRYLKYSKARSVSFANKNRHKFSDWICPDDDVTISNEAYTILGYLAYETVAQVVDLAFLVRQDQNKIYGDAIDRLKFSHVNPYTYKPYYHGKGTMTKPITPSEISEALRRYWSPQLDMTGPFNRCSMRRPHLKLLAC